MLETLLNVKEFKRLLKFELILDNTELVEFIADTIELLDVVDETLAEAKELEIKAELGLIILELTIEETGIIEELSLEIELEALDEVVGVALKTTFRGLLHGIVKSKFIAKKLYCTLQVKPSPEVKVCAVWALAFGVKVDEIDDTQSVKTNAEAVM